MFFQKFILFLAFLGFAFALAVPQDPNSGDEVSTVTVHKDVYVTSYAVITATRAAPAQTETAGPSVVSISTNTAAPTASQTSSATPTSSNGTISAPNNSGVPESGANALKVSSGLAMALVAVFAVML